MMDERTRVGTPRPRPGAVEVSPCPDPETLKSWLQGPASEQDEQEMWQHLEGCPDCAKQFDHWACELSWLEGIGPMPGRPARVGTTVGDRGDTYPPSLVPETPAEPPAPGRLGPYRLKAILGEGGMGRVYLAEGPEAGREVAVKVMKPEAAQKDEARMRFMREARAMEAVRDDHLVRIEGVGEEAGAPYLVMELLTGRTLDSWLETRRALRVEEALGVARQVCLALQALHERGLIHRDVKPANVWICHHEPGQAFRVKLLDLGLARVLGDAVTLTPLGLVMGTPWFMSPEQARGAEITPASDLFSLGSVLYRACTGELPFKGRSPHAVLMALVTEMPPSARSLNPEVPEGLASLVGRLLAKDPADRPPSARSVLATLDSVARELTPARASLVG